MTTTPERIMEEAHRLAKEAIFHGGVDWAAGDIVKALAAAEQRGGEMAADELDDLVDVRRRQKINRGNSYIAASAGYLRRSRSEGKGSE